MKQIAKRLAYRCTVGIAMLLAVVMLLSPPVAVFAAVADDAYPADDDTVIAEELQNGEAEASDEADGQDEENDEDYNEIDVSNDATDDEDAGETEIPAAPDAEVTLPNTVSVTVSDETFFTFTPNVTGYWTFITSDNAGTAPNLRITNHYGHTLANDSGTLGNNSIIKLHLVEGAPYIVHARGGGSGDFTLSVFVSDVFERPIRYVPAPVEIPGEGGFVRGMGGRMLYSFTPEESGFWIFDASSTGTYIEIEISDTEGNFIAGNILDWDPEFYAVVRLIGGVEYVIRGWACWEGMYTLEISPTDTFEPWLDWAALASLGVTLDFDAEMIEVPYYGGDILVETDTHFTFTPEETGLWVIGFDEDTWDVFMIITDTYGSFIMPIETFNWWQTEVYFMLEGGVEYILWASSWWDGNFPFYFTIQPVGEDFDIDNGQDGDLDWGNDWDIAQPRWDGRRISSSGGNVRLGNDNVFLFTPEEMGSWSFQLTDDSGSWLELSVTDMPSSFWINDWNHAIISMHLDPSTDYVIEAFSGWGAENTTLHVSPTYEMRLSGSQTHAARRITRETEFAFTPETTGYWLIYTTNPTGATDPMLWLHDEKGTVVAHDDDGGNGLNAMIKMRLQAGHSYTIRAGFFAGAGEYLLHVRLAGGQDAPELVELLPPAL